ncbi:hypothetical protein [Seonamhaeicola sp. ML3]|uniref:hypothetical protein n=1 Tax=Seonamhaeicola sp. ML3 TaxID=2937786 RepID=UPI00200DB38E|nr:hypothetical protein [Seonamhaeicola sp. ML3]
MRIGNTIGKATLLATVIFWLIIFSKVYEPEMFLYLLLSMVPICICCAITVTLTIAPFFWYEGKPRKTEKKFLNTFFPFMPLLFFVYVFMGCCGAAI